MVLLRIDQPSLRKQPTQRPTYSELLKHPFLVNDVGREVDMAGWVESSLAKRKAKGVPLAPVANLAPKA
jgi:mitogen-activated protein kinase kinase